MHVETEFANWKLPIIFTTTACYQSSRVSFIFHRVVSRWQLITLSRSWKKKKQPKDVDWKRQGVLTPFYGQRPRCQHKSGCTPIIRPMSPHLLNYARTNTRQVDKCRTSATSEFTVGKIATTSDSSAHKNTRTDDHRPFPIKGNSSGLCVFVQLKFARRTVETTGWRPRFLVDETFSRSEACLFFYNGEKERKGEEGRAKTWSGSVARK